MSDKSDTSYWISVSDMMSGLMLIFLYVVIVLISEISEESNISESVSQYKNVKDDLYYELYREFKDDLNKWHAHIDRETLTISFNEPEILFEKGESSIKPLFMKILYNFYPRYAKILANSRFLNDIYEVRIEGHTSSEWSRKTNKKEAYINNMHLSQMRTAGVLHFILNMRPTRHTRKIKDKIVSVGYSSSKLKYKNNVEDKRLSRRVEFRVVTKLESVIYSNQIAKKEYGVKIVSN